MPQLDGLRAIAAGCVLYSHFFPAEPVHDLLNWGYVGVRLFFVLSGFLITGILLDCRAKAVAGTSSRALLLNFYARRVLRIFPIYYLTLAIALPLSSNVDTLQIVSYLTYTFNWYVIAFGPDNLVAGHFWSLAVEEQFYLVWPYLILFTPRKWLLPALLITILVAPVVRLVLVLNHYSVIAITFNSLTCLDTLGMGGLLAYLTRHPVGPLTARWFVIAGFLAALPLAVVGFPAGLWPSHYVALFTVQDLFWGCLFVGVVGAAAVGIPGPLGWALQSGPLVYLGRISYGIYVYHGFVPDLLTKMTSWIGLSVPKEGYTHALVATAVTILLATVSWYALERPLSKLKDRFTYG